MSYKYRNDGTPDHVNSEDSNSTAVDQHFASDPGKKVAVDTVALKDRMDVSRKAALALAGGAGDAAYRGDTLSQHRLERAFPHAIYQAIAQQDTLDKARAGKIPVKKGK